MIAHAVQICVQQLGKQSCCVLQCHAACSFEAGCADEAMGSRYQAELKRDIYAVKPRVPCRLPFPETPNLNPVPCQVCPSLPRAWLVMWDEARAADRPCEQPGAWSRILGMVPAQSWPSFRLPVRTNPKPELEQHDFIYIGLGFIYVYII